MLSQEGGQRRVVSDRFCFRSDAKPINDNGGECYSTNKRRKEGRIEDLENDKAIGYFMVCKYSAFTMVQKVLLFDIGSTCQRSI